MVGEKESQSGDDHLHTGMAPDTNYSRADYLWSPNVRKLAI